MASSRSGSRRTSTRYSARPRKGAATGSSFSGMLAKLGLASSQLKSARGRRR